MAKVYDKPKTTGEVVTHVAATPGADFDTERGNRFIRLSFAGSMQDMEKAVEQLAKWLQKQG